MKETPQIANNIMKIGAQWKELWEQYGKDWEDKRKKEEYIMQLLSKIKKNIINLEKDLQN